MKTVNNNILQLFCIITIQVTAMKIYIYLLNVFIKSIQKYLKKTVDFNQLAVRELGYFHLWKTKPNNNVFMYLNAISFKK